MMAVVASRRRASVVGRPTRAVEWTETANSAVPARSPLSTFAVTTTIIEELVEPEHREVLKDHMASEAPELLRIPPVPSRTEVPLEEAGSQSLPSRAELVEEYKEAGQLHRLQIGLLFGQITVYLGISGGLFAVYFDQHRAQRPILDTGIPVAGLLLTLFLFIISERAGDYSHAARRRAVEIQNQLGFNLYMENSRPAAFGGLATAINATRGIYALGFVAWLITSFVWP
jgi:hypothetical protein